MAGILTVLFVLFLLALFIVPLLRQKQSPSDLDLGSVCNAMIEKHGWTAERAETAQVEYVRFLTLLQKKPGFMLVPWLDAQGRDDLDQFWHQHILDTAKYANDCKALFGRMIHHNPHVVRGSDQEKDSVEKTRRLYTRTFSSGTYGTEADPADYSSCSACGTSTSYSHSHAHSSHSDQSSDSGSHGGHSCSGHSCGGHSCGGHGCGGH